MKQTPSMTTVLPHEGQTNEEKTSYMTLFCALMTAKHSKATLEELMSVIPMGSKAKRVAGELASDHSQQRLPKAKQNGLGRDPVDILIEDLVRRYRNDSSLQKVR